MSIISKLPIIRIFYRWYEYITRPAPLNDFNGYDEYWDIRKQDGLLIRELDRFKIIASLIEDNDTVLDIGCGDCSFQAYLKKVRPNCQSLGLDFSEQAIEYGKKTGCEAQLLNLNTPLKEQIAANWSTITLMEVIEHIPDAESLIKEVIDLNPKKIFITIPNVGCLKHRARLMFGGRFPITTIVFHMKEHVRFWTAKDFAQWCDTLGLEVQAVYGQFSYGDRLVEFFTRKFPTLFADQVVYELKLKK